MKICRKEKIYAAEFFGLLLSGATLVAGVIMAGSTAVSTGGSWWVIFFGAAVGATVAGEIIKKRMEKLVKLSRDVRGTATGSSKGKTLGFTLVEIMTVVTLVGVLSSLAVPAFQAVRLKAQNSALMNDLRTFESAFLLYNMEMGEWPGDQNRAILPPEMSGYIPGNSFTRETPIGGHYDWDPSSSGSLPGGIGAAISVRAHKATSAQLEALVRILNGGGTDQLRINGTDIHFVIQ